MKKNVALYKNVVKFNILNFPTHFSSRIIFVSFKSQTDKHA